MNDEIDMVIPIESNAPYSTVLKDLIWCMNNLKTYSEQTDTYYVETFEKLATLLSVELDLQLKLQEDYVRQYNNTKAKEKKATLTAIK